MDAIGNKRRISRALRDGDSHLPCRPPRAVNIGSAEGYVRPLGGLLVPSPKPSAEAIDAYMRAINMKWVKGR